MLPDCDSFRGAVLADQPRSVEKRLIKHAGRAPDIVLTEVRKLTEFLVHLLLPFITRPEYRGTLRLF
jgi:hypothetical protein